MILLQKINNNKELLKRKPNSLILPGMCGIWATRAYRNSFSTVSYEKVSVTEGDKESASKIH